MCHFQWHEKMYPIKLVEGGGLWSADLSIWLRQSTHRSNFLENSCLVIYLFIDYDKYGTCSVRLYICQLHMIFHLDVDIIGLKCNFTLN